MFENLTFLIPTRNRAKDLRMAIERTCSAGLGDAMFLVYDDASDDPQQTERAASVAPRHKVVRGSPRRGQAWARNRLAELCETDWFFLLDDDCSIAKTGRLAELVEGVALGSGASDVAIYAPEVIRTYDGLRFYPDGAPGMRLPSFPGGAALVQRERFMRAGGFREWLIYRNEEEDLAARLFRHGWFVVFEPTVLVEHWHTPSARNNSEYDYLSARNTVLFHYLNFPGFWGFPAGVLRSIRLLGRPAANRRAVLRGLLEAPVYCHRHRRERTRLSREQYKEYRHLWAGRGRGAEAVVRTGYSN